MAKKQKNSAPAKMQKAESGEYFYILLYIIAQRQKTCLPMVVMTGRVRIHLLDVFAGL